MKRKPTPRGLAASLNLAVLSAWPLGTPAFVWAMVLPVVMTASAIAAPVAATPSTVVGATITDPNTGADVKVTGLITYKDAGLTASDVTDPNVVVYVVTDLGKAILVQTADSAVMFKVDPSTGSPEFGTGNVATLYQVKSRTTDATTTLVTGVSVYLKGQDPSASGTVFSNQNASFAIVTPPADPATPPNTPALGSGGRVDLVWTGKGGSNGHAGAIFVSAGDGGNGSNGPANTQNIDSSHGNIPATNAPGIRVASVGGNGGKGGNSYVNLNGGGGDGGYAGSGGAVNLTNSVDVTVTGDNAAGIQAYSQSGKGGVGGGGYLALGGGGNGGESRNGGSVTVDNSGNLSTDGSRSHGISALSSGGAAGSGGNSFGLVGVGGSGAKAGNGDSVSITNSGSITTHGYASHGILAQSIGGTGGDGGIGAGLVGFSGDGSTGGKGGQVTVTLNAGSNIATFGELSSAVVAQSIGGGGGDSGFSGGIAAFGGTGGAGNDAGVVTVTTAAGTHITTGGNLSSGIVAQSIGGGGGSGGSTGGLVALNLGGSNSGGGDGKNVTVQNGGNIGTSGMFSSGIFAQSIGGGGGSAGNAGGLIALGGKGSSGGSSGQVTVGNSGVITTDGKFSQGIIAQSIAGGGGSGGDAGGLIAIGGSSTSGGSSDKVTVTNTGSIRTLKDKSDGILAQSIGGGGGNAGSGVGVVAIGGSASAATGGNAGEVVVSNDGAIKTSGNDSRGVFAQAVGGGGGNGGAGTAGGVFVGFSLGGTGGAGGDGAKVTLFLDPSAALPALSPSQIQTTGDRAIGIFGQSVGGGGGSGGDSITGTVGVYGSVSVAIGGDGARGGKGGEVLLSGTGRVSTTGDMAHGVLLESVGGGGGAGGMSIAASVAVGDVGAAAVSVALGGGGGAGGDGGIINVTDADMNIMTTGLQSSGFIAQSVGGGGGSGGIAIAAAAAASLGDSGAFSVGLGGDGEAGGVGGNVDVTLGGSVTTSKAQSDGILIQSVGGGGGNGGMTVAGSLGLGVGAAGAISVGVGGTGSGGGNAGTVTANITSDIDTNGDGSDGLILQAVGGGGGNGGLSVAAGIAGAGVGAGSITLGIGGSGAGGGTGNVVMGSYAGTVITRGDNSTGILAQSVGGGGGNGGGSVSANLNAAGVGAGGIALGLGGKGASGGDGGAAGVDLAVHLETSGSVTTLGKNSDGIVAQSIGGGGGNGGFSVAGTLSGAGPGAASISIGLGGAGSGGGNGKRVEAILQSDVSTLLENSTGILVQSVGGGGGSGGFNVSGALSGAGVGSAGITVGLGGKGGKGGTGGDVNASSSGTIQTGGDRSDGFVVQSLGGGGGNGGFNVSGSLSGAGTGSGAISVGLGGGAGAGNLSGTVTALSSGDIDTFGKQSTGMLVQSVGGGGGNGGFNVSGAISGAGTGSGGVSVGLGGNGGTGGTGGIVNATSNGHIITRQDGSSGFVIQSLGGGGGNGGFNVSGALSGAGTGSGALSVGLGGNGGSGNDAMSVTALSTKFVETYGNQSDGILAQSVGGGGGNGGFNVSGTVSGAGTGSGGVNVGLGGGGGSAGNGGTVNLTVHNTVFTGGNQSTAVTGQSIGGGGGNGGFNISAIGSGAGTGSGTVGVGLGGSGAGGGNGEAVVVSTTGDILTLGKSSGGILAQSVGGGGGSGGFDVNVAGSGAGTGSGAVAVGLGGSGAGGGNASSVDLTTRNNVQTTLGNSSGIVAQSIGGGGGNGAFDVTVAGSGAGTGSGALSVSLGGSAGTGGFGERVTSDVIGNIQTAGDNSLGFLSQSVGGGGGNGGFSVSTAISGAGTGSAAGAVSLGGSGGDGGHAGIVTSTYTGNITTTGNNSTGLVSQSIGGGGGNGGFSIAGTISAAKTGSFAASVGIGGSGGGGSYAGAVNNTVVGNVTTSSVLIPDSIDPLTHLLVPAHFAEKSGGILAQSLGGGGGNGGFNVSGSLSLAQTGSAALSIGIGGSGGDGGYSQKVTNTVTGDVFTSGKFGFGIAAQSLGGGGGNGGMDISGTIAAAKSGSGALGIGIGGFGGNGGAAGDVANTVTGYVQTLGDNATGILAQSLGGGGGNGGMNITGVITAAKTGSGNVGFGLGGFGGGGGDGKIVTNHVTGGTVTTGNDSQAIVAQSLGGGGGNGGMNVTGTLNITKDNGGTLGIGIGGFGGDGGNASDVTSIIKTTTGHNQIATSGDHSSAVVAQSIGGGGGGGALNVTGAVNLTGKNGAAVGVGLGGFGGGAGNAGIVTVDVDGDITTRGQDSHGLLAQSIGGAGGNGGTNITGTLAITNSTGGSSTTVAASIGVGGFGGGGGTAGAVDVKYNGTISALPGVYHPPVIDPVSHEITPGYFELHEGKGSNGLVAQSIGGGGGNGGLDVSAGISYARGEGDAYGLMFGVGGFGGAGGNADQVDVLVTGGTSISAYGANHSAILAQSVGGGGGDGATNISGGIVSDSPLIVGVGGFGGNAGIAKNVTVTATTDVFASAADSKDFSSAGIMAQSLGGGGGNGGLNVSGGIAISKESTVPSITVGVGGFGGAGAISGDVTVDHTGNIVTSGNWIHGIMAQSIAGGGGNGGMNVSSEINFADSDNSGGKTDLTVVAGIGGNAGTGADAGNVKVTQNGIVTTHGDYARGIAAQSIGGGGGTGGMNIDGVFAKNSSPIIVGVGGTGGGGGHAGSATVIRGTNLVSTGKVTTDGKGAYGIEASSIGGGGGDAGMNFNAGVTLAGKDGTDAGFAANFAIGGAGGVAGNGAAAKVTNFSDIETQQAASHGIISQSIGGGGGNASFNVAVTYAGSSGGGALYNKPNKNLGFNLAIGGAPGDGGHGGTSDVIQVGNIETWGKNSYGILSQSIGGGGGNAGLDFAFVKADGGKAGITIGRVGGIGGYASNVTLSSTGSVTTHGDGSFGMLAQSVGNGGGNSSSTTIAGEIPSEESDTGEVKPHAASVAIGLEGGIGGYAGNVDLDTAGFITTCGEKAHAIFAQSVGGGGGNGGNANTFGITAATASLSLGGVGGQGGYGGDVKVRSSAQVQTSGNESIGILAQSVGGGGGNGGMSTSGGTKNGDSGINVGIGGGGGVGMTGGLVTVDNSGIIITGGEGAHGVLAQSIGGGGGNGGMANSSILKASTTDSTRASMNIGGDGGDGATGGDVIVTNTGGIGTNKDDSMGIFAQSIGGGGGNGKAVVNNSVAGTEGNNFSINLGGTGGTGATGGHVTVSNKLTADPNSGKIITVGNFSHGILAMSVGGGGGNGSTTVNVNRAGISDKTSTANTVAFNLGGSGGQGGTGGDVDVLNEGGITTYGFKSNGILAQSIGGGGGNGGSSYSGDFALGSKTATASGKIGLFSIGGIGGDGNRSGDVHVTNSGSIETFGVKSSGIFAQSVGGGGGDGGVSMVFSRNSLKNPKTDLASSLMNFALGGFGGSGADSGNVTIDHSGSIISHGDNSFGIFAQSVAGGGGNAGHSISSPAWTAADLALNTVLGGGSSGQAGIVSINTTGTISMLGNNSTAQFAQSVNGGGGNLDLFLDVSKHAVAIGDDGIQLPDNGGDVDKVKDFVKSNIKLGTDAIAGAVGTAIDATHVGNFYTEGENSIGSLIQSIGGGGGNATQEVVVDTNASVDLNLALGAKDSTNSKGGDVTQTRTGNIATSGDQSLGSLVQSIGGGGGNLSVHVQAVPDDIALAPTFAPAHTMFSPSPGFTPLFLPPPPPPLLSTTAALGADGGSANDGGAITVISNGDVSTTGERAYGLIYQSIGGGGGKLDISGFDALELSLGGTNGASGNGGEVLLTNDGNISTTGDRADGIVIQSIGGGGGALFSDLTSNAISLTLNHSNSGNGGNISFTQTGDIRVSGADAIGIVAQSIGGGGGIVDRLFAGTAGGVGISGTVTLDLEGNVFASGANGTAVLAQSLAADGQGNILITLANGKAAFAGIGGTVMDFSGGAKNRFTNFGTVIGADGLTTMSTRGGNGDEFIDNHGVFYGQFDLGTGANSFLNRHDALLVAGPSLKLGDSANTLTNSGIISLGDTGLAQRTALTGSLVQNSDGEIDAELDFGTDKLDGLDVTGSAKLAGEVKLALLNPQLVKSGDFQKDLVTGPDGVSDDGMKLITAPSVVIEYGITYDTGTAAVLNYSVDFSAFGKLGRNLTEAGDYFNRIQNAGSSFALADTVIKLLYDPTLADYRFSLSQLAPDFYGEQQAQMIRSSQRFAEILATGGNPASASVKDGRMVWFDYENGQSTHSSYGDYKTVHQGSERYTVGIQQEFRPNWIAGIGFGIEDIDASGYDGRWRSEGATQQLGAVLKTSVGATKISGIVAYNWSSASSHRTGDVTGPFDTDVRRDMDSLTALLRFSQDYKYKDSYLSPVLDIGYTRLMAQAATETGGGATSLALQDYDENHAWVRPAVQVGTFQGLGHGLTLHSHAEAGLQYFLTDSHTNVVAGFTGAPSGVDYMDTPIDLGTNTYINLGLDLTNDKGVSLGLGYTRQIDKNYSQNIWNIRLSAPF